MHAFIVREPYNVKSSLQLTAGGTRKEGVADGPPHQLQVREQQVAHPLHQRRADCFQYVLVPPWVEEVGINFGREVHLANILSSEQHFSTTD